MTSYLLYDPDCGFCTSTAQAMQGWGLGCRIEPMSPRRLAELGVDERRAARELPFVDEQGRTSHGAEAFGRALATGRGPVRLAGRLLASPALLWLAQPIYRQVAAHRHQLPGGTGACQMLQR
ncbi:thiol-disulfide oxidoreductase DCC family protein [Luteococcus peritonei]|uniref:Thiol-disulfide oxidoreductase DCC family protein n=1 Tax=Luteococcus peritonei TaxID=88874 RepID=A0ABW4RW21_9ACTN